MSIQVTVSIVSATERKESVSSKFVEEGLVVPPSMAKGHQVKYEAVPVTRGSSHMSATVSGEHADAMLQLQSCFNVAKSSDVPPSS